MDTKSKPFKKNPDSFDLIKVTLVSITLSTFLLSFACLLSAIAPQALTPYIPLSPIDTFKNFSNILYLFLFAFSALSFLGVLIKKIKWRWCFIWFVCANFLGLLKQYIETWTLKTNEANNLILIALCLFPATTVCTVLTKGWLSKSAKGEKIPLDLKKSLKYLSHLLAILAFILLIGFVAPPAIKANLSQMAIMLLAVILPLNGASTINYFTNNKAKGLFTLTALSFALIMMILFLSVPPIVPFMN